MVLYVTCYLWRETFTALDVEKIFRSRVQMAKMNSPWPMAMIDFDIARFMSPLLKLSSIVRANYVGVT